MKSSKTRQTTANVTNSADKPYFYTTFAVGNGKTKNDKEKHAPSPYHRRTKSSIKKLFNPKKSIIMGRIKKGILGGISGKVGTVVGANWKTTSYIRSLPQNVKNPRTLGQRRQRSKFALVVALLRQLNVILRIGWKLFAKSQSPFNACTAYTLANAVKGTFPNFEIDYSKVLISCGSLAGATNGTASVANGDLVLSWDNNSGINSAEPTDTTLVAVINTAKSETIAQTTGVERSKETQTIKIPANWLGDDVEVYLGFVSEDGKEVANSVHIGKV